jgi:predicted protein tyrosine phosphatase
MAAQARKELVRKTCGTTTRVDAHVHIGGYLAAADPAHVEARGFTHILKLFADDPSYAGGAHRHPGVAYMVVDADDLPGYPLDRHFAGCLRFVQGAVRDGGQVLVHCHAGVSRSSTIVLLHLMINTGLPLHEAYSQLKAARPVVSPNRGFWAMLAAVDERSRRFRQEGRAPARPNLTAAGAVPRLRPAAPT